MITVSQHGREKENTKWSLQTNKGKSKQTPVHTHTHTHTRTNKQTITHATTLLTLKTLELVGELKLR